MVDSGSTSNPIGLSGATSFVAFQESDLDAVLGLFVEMLDDLSSHKRGSGLARRTFDRFSGAFFAKDDADGLDIGEILVARLDGVSCGFSILKRLDEVSAEFIVFVTKGKRNCGLGGSLVAAVARRGDELGLRHTSSIVAPGARASKSTLEKQGFKAQELKMIRPLKLENSVNDETPAKTIYND